jgi:ATP-binding cassette, subfamily B, multidrug efflux pump
VLLFGIVVLLLWLDWQLGLLTLSVLPVLFLVRIVWLPRARAAFIARTGGELGDQRRAGRGDPRRAHRAGHDRQTVNLRSSTDKARTNLRAQLRAKLRR